MAMQVVRKEKEWLQVMRENAQRKTLRRFKFMTKFTKNKKKNKKKRKVKKKKDFKEGLSFLDDAVSPSG